MADPLSIAASITGLLTAAGEVCKVLGPYVSAAWETPKIAAQVHSEAQSIAIILAALQKLSKNLGSVPAKYATLVQVDQIIAILTDGTLLYSELEASLNTLPAFEPAGARLALSSRLQWARKETAFVPFLARLQGFKSSISLILSILQSDSDLRALQLQEELAINVKTILETNKDLSRRLMNLEDSFDVQTIASRRRSLGLTAGQSASSDHLQQPTNQDRGHTGSNSLFPSVSTAASEAQVSASDFQDDLEASRVYRRAQRNTTDFSFRSSIAGTNAWSIFSGLSLSDISIISAVALPIYAEDLANPQHYTFGVGDGTSVPKPEAQKPSLQGRRTILECIEIKLQLCQIQGFAELFEGQGWNHLLDGPVARGRTPLALLQHVLGRGFPLLMLLNVVENRWDLSLYRGANQARFAKRAVTEFFEYCSETRDLTSDDLPTAEDFLSGNIVAFMQVVTIVKSILAHLMDIGFLRQVDPKQILPSRATESVHCSQRTIAIEEFCGQERSYVSQLQALTELSTQIEKYNLLSAEDARSVFEYVPMLLEAHMWFLDAVEMNEATWSDMHQRWKEPFAILGRISDSYATFISMQQSHKELLRSAWKKQWQYEGDRASSLLSPALKLFSSPSERLPKYQSFLQELLTPESVRHLDETMVIDLQDSLTLVEELLRKVDQAVEERRLSKAVADLERYVKDWKSHNLRTFGRLLLFDNLYVNPPRDTRRPIIFPYSAYLFENVLIVCKRIYQTKKGNRTIMFWRERRVDESQGPVEFQLKGRIFAVNITDVVTLTKNGKFLIPHEQILLD